MDQPMDMNYLTFETGDIITSMDQQLDMNYLKFETESVCNYLLDLLLQRKKLPRETAKAFKYISNITMRFNHILNTTDTKYIFKFSSINLPYFVTLTAEQCYITNKTLLYKSFQKTEMIITLEPNKVLLFKNNIETILYENSLANKTLNPIYDSKPFTTRLLDKYKVN